MRCIKRLLFLLPYLLNLSLASGQKPDQKQPKANWYNLDLEKDSVLGTGINRAYQELLKDKQPNPVIVAVIDGGVDIHHEDLRQVIWKNLKEIPGNLKDDDGNGYVDDVNGWNFLGSPFGDFEYDNDLLVIQVREGRTIFKNADSLKVRQKYSQKYESYLANEHALKEKLDKSRQNVMSIRQLIHDLSIITQQLQRNDPSLSDFEQFNPKTEAEIKAKNFITAVLRKRPDFKSYIGEVENQLKENELDVDYHLNIDYDPRGKYPNQFGKHRGGHYGSPNVIGPVPPAHGTHVAGVIAAQRNNNIGIDGVASCARIMVIRAIPDGYGQDKDQAYAIRYAADNGAKVINMSFGLSVAMDKKLVKDAVDYALKKDILFIQAAGNGHDNLDLTASYPNRQDGTDEYFVDSFIKVGASGFKDDYDVALPFSNFGKQSVDLFAPGEDINSTIPKNNYEAHSGTSMAGPVVSGVVAVIRSYFPKLKAPQVKQILMKTARIRKSLSELSVSGGIVNAYEALKLAAKY